MKRSSAYRLMAAAITLSLCVAAPAAVRAEGARSIDDLVQALQAADAWVNLLDQGKIEACYAGTAPILQQHTPLAQWKKDLEAVREKFGTVSSRQFQAVEAATKLPPDNVDGKYFVVVYEATFTLRPKASQIVTMMWDEKKSAWLVAGYYVR